MYYEKKTQKIRKRRINTFYIPGVFYSKFFFLYRHGTVNSSCSGTELLFLSFVYSKTSYRIILENPTINIDRSEFHKFRPVYQVIQTERCFKQTKYKNLLAGSSGCIFTLL